MGELAMRRVRSGGGANKLSELVGTGASFFYYNDSSASSSNDYIDEGDTYTFTGSTLEVYRNALYSDKGSPIYIIYYVPMYNLSNRVDNSNVWSSGLAVPIIYGQDTVTEYIGGVNTHYICTSRFVEGSNYAGNTYWKPQIEVTNVLNGGYSIAIPKDMLTFSYVGEWKIAQ